jgi:tetratricopeptide (TPR) repeat protein
MRAPISLTALALAFWIGAACLCARSARADEAQAASAATEEHDRGVRAFAAGRYRQAIELFRRADALKPSAAIAFNVASAYERLGDRAAAAAAYREYLRRAPDAKDARSVERRIRALKAPAQKVIVHSAPAGASLSIDGKPVGVTPYTAELETGLHTLEVRLTGFANQARVLEVTPGMPEQLAVVMTAVGDSAAPAASEAAPLSTTSQAPLAPRRFSTTAAPGAPREERERTSTVGVLGWVAMGGAVAAFGGALTLEIMRRAEEDRARRAQTQIGFYERVDTMQTQQTAALALAATGAGLTALGGALLFVDASNKEERAQRQAPGLSARLILRPGVAGAQLNGRY